MRNGNGFIDNLTTNFPITGTSTSQSCSAHPTPEAESVSLDSALNKIAIGTFSLHNTILQRDASCGKTTRTFVHEDNTATIQVCHTGRNPTMKTLPRNFGINIGSLYQTFKNKDEYEVLNEDSKSMRAEIFTKGFTDPGKWITARELINVADFNGITIQRTNGSSSSVSTMPPSAADPATSTSSTSDRFL